MPWTCPHGNTEGLDPIGCPLCRMEEEIASCHNLLDQAQAEQRALEERLRQRDADCLKAREIVEMAIRECRRVDDHAIADALEAECDWKREADEIPDCTIVLPVGPNKFFED